MEFISDFLNSEKTLYLFAGIIGTASVVLGLLFLIFSGHKSFATTMIVIGLLEMAAMFPTYLKYPKKIEHKIATYQSNRTEFLQAESVATQKALKSFFWLKLVYGIVIVALVVTMSFLASKSILFGIFTALILHLGFAIAIDSFGEKYTDTYLEHLTTALK
ncbi:hypothetical protein [Zobellia uliginosa]|uniref:hypothetical protein n=1 Tax=Zobellia uliginosa TaxID=143224 RepID=UPI0026E2BAF2|nr:hypothetical protein [Zobellia uliginosa]MDO6519576.1 hypothetical protein [Zobellia uliginosa]